MSFFQTYLPFRSIQTFFLLLLVLLSTIGVAQNDTINQTDENGLRQGYWIKQYKSGKKNAEGYFKDGKQIGTFTHYFESKIVKSILKHRINSDTSDAVFFHESGSIMAEGIYINKKREGLWIIYDGNKRIASAEVYHNGVRNGKSQVFYLNQTIAKEVNYVDDLEDGVCKEYFNDGTLKLEGTYKLGKYNGQIRHYYPNGKLKIIGSHIAGKRNGKWTYFDEKGEQLAQEVYKNGKRTEQNLSEDAQKKKDAYFQQLNNPEKISEEEIQTPNDNWIDE